MCLSRCSSLAIGVAGAVVFALSSGARAASSFSREFSCDTAEEVYEEHLGELDGQPLQLRICTAPDGESQRTLILSHWTAPEGEASDVWQTLFDGHAPPVAGAYTPNLSGSELTLFYPSGLSGDPDGQVTTDTWTWTEKQRQFGAPRRVTTSPWAERLARFDEAAARGDVAEADAALRALGATPNGGKTWLDDELYTRFLVVVKDEAIRRHRLFDADGAARLALSALTDPPVTSPEERPKPGQLVICRDLSASCSGVGSFNDLPADGAHANLLAALVFIVARGEAPEKALTLLDGLLSAFPESGDIYRIQGDALWASERPDEARAAWRTAQALGVVLSKKTSRRLGD